MGSSEHHQFAEIIIDIIGLGLNQYGFVLHKKEIEKDSSEIVFRNDKLYIKIVASTYPTDYPYYYNILLGECESTKFLVSDWDSIPLWRMKKKKDPNLKVDDYAFPFGDKIQVNLNNAKDELLKYGSDFLTGDLEIFHEIRTEQNQD